MEAGLVQGDKMAEKEIEMKTLVLHTLSGQDKHPSDNHSSD